MSSATVIEVELLSGRYHAHVWGESQFGMAGPEWPPSPWRLLRALAAAWFGARPAPSAEQDRDELLEALGCSGPPELWLPKTSLHELRYYQPVWREASYRPVLHHDHFSVPEGGRFWFKFDVPLSTKQQRLLADLLARIHYFGRSESRARLRVANVELPPQKSYRVVPVCLREASQRDEHYISCRVLCTTGDFRASDLWRVRAGDSGAPGAPPHLVDRLIGKRMPLPSGTRWVDYAVPSESLASDIRPARVPAAQHSSTVGVTEIRFRLSRRIPIPVSLLVALSRAFRDAVVHQYERIVPGHHSRILTGREPDGTVSRGHQHVYYLPRVKASSGTIDKLAVVIPSGQVTREELDAIVSVGRITLLGESEYPVIAIVEDLVKSRANQEPARRWRSVTPFLLPVRYRWNQRFASLEEQMGWWIERLCGGRLLEVARMTGRSGSGWVLPLWAHDYSKGRPGVGRSWRLTRRLGFWLEVTFAQPVALTLPIGADAHFGAGQFTPIGN